MKIESKELIRIFQNRIRYIHRVYREDECRFERMMIWVAAIEIIGDLEGWTEMQAAKGEEHSDEPVPGYEEQDWT